MASPAKLQTTVKQRAFAKLVAQGTPQSKAYEQVYGRNGGQDRTRRIAAFQETKKPAVAAAIAEYEDLLAPVHDMRALRQEMLANIRWLAKHADDQRVRLTASQDLRDYADERVKRDEAQAKTLTIDHLLSEIHQLTEPAQEPTVELEAETAEAAASAGSDEPDPVPAAQEPPGSLGPADPPSASSHPAAIDPGAS